jgi:hypothetical protein
MAVEFLAIGREKDLCRDQPYVIICCFVAMFPGIDKLDIHLPGKIIFQLFQDWRHFDTGDTLVGADVDQFWQVARSAVTDEEKGC